jgi:putative hydrolase of the HAD superfamily
LRPYLLLDAGWTLVFPDYPLMHRVVLQHGYDVPAERLRRVMAQVTRDYDESLRSGRGGWDTVGFFARVLNGAGVRQQHVPPIARQLETKDAEHSLWAYTYPWVRRAVARLAAQGYRMSVISNADGRVEADFAELGLARHFEGIYDSHVVGYAKPDPRLFQHAMMELGLRPADCLYVGDVYYVDVLGANRAGIAAVHLDPYGLYDGWPGVHIPSVAALPDWMAQDLDLRSDKLFPLRGSPP